MDQMETASIAEERRRSKGVDEDCGVKEDLISNESLSIKKGIDRDFEFLMLEKKGGGN